MEVNEYNSLAGQIEKQLNQAGTLINFCVPGHLGYIEFRDSFHEDIPLDHLVIRADIVIAKRKFIFFFPLHCDLFIDVHLNIINSILQKISYCIQDAILEPDKIPEGHQIISDIW